MKKDTVIVEGDKFVYSSGFDHKVWVESNNTETWQVHAQHAGVHGVENASYDSPFAALQTAWRIAVATRTVRDAFDFQQILEESFGMKLESRRIVSLELAALIRADAGKKGSHRA